MSLTVRWVRVRVRARVGLRVMPSQPHGSRVRGRVSRVRMGGVKIRVGGLVGAKVRVRFRVSAKSHLT